MKGQTTHIGEGANGRVSAERVADALVLCLPGGVSLRAWADHGVLGREWGWYGQLGEAFGRVVVVETLPGADTGELGVRPWPGGEARAERVVVRESVEAGPLVAQVLGQVDSVVVRTHQFDAGPTAMCVASALRARGVCTALVARGGRLWSRIVASESAPDSPEALRAGEVEGEICRSAEGVVGTTAPMVDNLCWRHGVHPERAAVVPCPVLSAGPVPGPESRERGLIVACGRLIVRKRFELLLEAMAKTNADVRGGLRAVIIGRGPEEARLRSLASSLGVRVEFRPTVGHDELLTLLEGCTLYVQPSAMETHPRTVLEAMAAGAPALVAEAPGLGDSVQHGITGIRFHPDPDSLAMVISELIHDEDWRELLGRSASSTTREQHAVARLVPRELEVHRSAMSRAQAGSREADGLEAAMVRWSPRLSTLGVDEAARCWSRGLSAYLNQLDPASREAFIRRLGEGLGRSA